MPRPTMPPTPASSTDLPGRDGQHLASLDGAFSLPPPAMMSKPEHDAAPAISATSDAATIKRAVTPVSPVATEESPSKRRRASGPRSAGVKEDFTLPPPPTRSRKIIQMKPRPQKSAADSSKAPVGAAATPSSAATSGTASTPTKGKGANASSAAGRKVARKTAHSLIERRRRSKMNEEFSVLKQMIPACRDQEMHKLAILQAGIEYLGYLERCVTDLEANARRSPAGNAQTPSEPFSEKRKLGADEGDTRDGQTESGPIPELDENHQTQAMPSQLTSPSAWSPSPALVPHQSTSSYASTTSVSPAILPNSAVRRDLDHEATEALLMLTKDRRGSSARGMSVKDLLTP
ncbi:MAG: hypothetical protein M1823_001652 [Watsoniomyces obsoletus]|nr:MAG: hypothetical protein M1823_001652 [Watsoniomyces obsoletus]